MGKDIDKELDDIMRDHKSRVAETIQAAVDTVLSENVFRESWAKCLNGVIRPTLEEMRTKLMSRGIVTKVQPYGSGGWGIWVQPPAEARRLPGEDRWPHLGVTPNVGKKAVAFERSSSAIVRATRVGEFAPTEVTADTVRQQVLDLVGSSWSG
jgi:hypothetical protein